MAEDDVTIIVAIATTQKQGPIQANVRSNQEAKPLFSNERKNYGGYRKPYGRSYGRITDESTDSDYDIQSASSWWKQKKTTKKKASFYALFVLLVMLLVYLMNQLSRYTLPVIARYIGGDLDFGVRACIPDVSAIKDYLIFFAEDYSYSRSTLINDYYPACLKAKNELACKDQNILVDNHNGTFCKWGYDGSQGTSYKVLAGPVFNNMYPFAGIFMGLLVDQFNRKTILLGLSLLFWSIATGATGLAWNYSILVVCRLLLAIGAAGCTPFAVSIISDYFPQNLRGTAISLYYWGIYIGYSLSYVIGNSIIIEFGWRWVLLITALMGIVVVPVVIFLVKDLPQNKENDRTDLILKSCDRQLNQFVMKLILLLKTFILPGMFMLCIAGGIRNAGGYVWTYNAQSFYQSEGYSDATIVSVIPLVGGCLGAILGGVISDFLVTKCGRRHGSAVRIWVLMISQLLAAPFAAGALFLPKPWCFLSLIPSNIIGEMWVGVASATIVDLTPTVIRTSSIALYLFIITIIGGNFNIVVPPIQKQLKKVMHGDQDAIDCNSFRWAVFFTYPALYALSSVMFLISFLLMHIDKKIKLKKAREVRDTLINTSVEVD